MTKPIQHCKWRLDDEDSNVWETDCGHMFSLYEETPLENEMIYCCFCGKFIHEVDTEVTFN